MYFHIRLSQNYILYVYKIRECIVLFWFLLFIFSFKKGIQSRLLYSFNIIFFNIQQTPTPNSKATILWPLVGAENKLKLHFHCYGAAWSFFQQIWISSNNSNLDSMPARIWLVGVGHPAPCCVGWRRISWLVSLRTWFDKSSSQLFV